MTGATMGGHGGRARHLCALILLVGLSHVGAAAHAADWTDKIKFSGHVQSDIRFMIEDYRGAVPGDGYKFEMNRNDVELKLKIIPNRSVQAVVSGRLRFYGFNEAAQLTELVGRDKIDPHDLQLNEAYLAVRGKIWDLKVGRMVQTWGTADMFNPTSNLSSYDFSDPLDYMAKVPNQMVEFDLYPTDWLTIKAVWVPLFKPSLLPPSTYLGFAVETSRDGCFLNAPTPPLSRNDIDTLETVFNQYDPCSLNFLTPDMAVVIPEFSIANSQAAIKTQFRFALGDVGDLDFSFSYYYGRFSFPIAYTAAADLMDSATLGPGNLDVMYNVELMYPRMHVAGFDFSFSAASDKVPGLFGELAVTFPEEVIFGLAVLRNDVILDNLQMSSVNVPTTPFVKATVGLDYTFTKWLYVNVQYVRGFMDEFNDAYGIHNYVVPALEMKFLDNVLQFRIAAAWNVDDLSAAMFPQMTWVAAPSVELILGVWAYLGDTKPRDSKSYGGRYKFGQKAAGRSVVYLKGKVSW